jgi:aromatic-L-amino-acid/L-tryptophan decarboxylase
MDPQEFRRWGHAMIDWLADYPDRCAELPVLSRLSPGEFRSGLPAAPPRQGEDFAALFADIDRLLPGLTHWQSPNFFAYFPANTSGPSILGELLSAGLGVQGMLWATSPACTELETHVLDWLAELCGLPARFLSTGKGGGVLQDSASSAVLCALLAARERATGGAGNRAGITGLPRLTAYTSAEAHSSIHKAVRIAGIGDAQLRVLPVQPDGALDPVVLEAAIAADRAAACHPFFCMATIGSTSRNAVDPVAAIASVCQQQGLWLHVDAAMAGSAALCPELRHYFAGLEGADSYCFNPHKWLFTNFDCDAFWVADRAALVDALSILPEYLRNTASLQGDVIDYRDWQIPLGRRFRALKLWFVLRWYGADGLQDHLRRHLAWARAFADWVDADPDFERVGPVPFSLVCFRHRSDDARNQALLDALNASGRLYLSHTVIDGRYCLRMSIGSTHTERHHVEQAWQAMRETAQGLIAAG